MTMDQEIIEKLIALHNDGKLKWERSYWKKRHLTYWNKGHLTCHLSQDLTIWLSEGGHVDEVEYKYINRWEDKYDLIAHLAGRNQAGAELYKLAEAQYLASIEDQKQREKKQEEEKHGQKQAAFLKELETL